MSKDKKLQKRKEAIKRDYLSAFQLNERIFAGLNPNETEDSSDPHQMPSQPAFSDEWEEFGSADDNGSI